MTEPSQTAAAAEHELLITRLMDVAKEKLFRCWTEPALLKQWFAPKPYSVSHVESDLRAGGASTIVMRAPDGHEFPNPGVYLEIVPNRKLVFTDAFGAGWVPAGQPFMVAQITFDDENGKTRYTARAWHWNAEAKAKHEEMGFHKGWSTCADQLEALAKTL